MDAQVNQLVEQMQEQKQRIHAAADYLAQHLPPARLAVVLGSGLGGLEDVFTDKQVVDYQDVPFFPPPTVPGHSGKVIFGRVAGQGVYLFSGRFHYYEGNDPATVILPMRVVAALGCDSVILTNAAGGVDPSFTAGDLMAITDHINFTGYNPLRGYNDEEWGPRFPDMSAAYDKDYIAAAQAVAQEMGFSLRLGVYGGFAGPNFETPAEIRMMHLLGVSAVGMSTVPEVIAARQAGLRVLAISCITNLAAGVKETPLSHEEVFAASKEAGPRFAALLAGVIGKIYETA